jgi:TolB-like protein
LLDERLKVVSILRQFLGLGLGLGLGRVRVRTREGPVRYYFQDCSLDYDRRELHRDGVLQSIEPQVLDLLVFLIANRERVVPKQELITRIWKGRIVSESALSTRLHAARTAVGDSGERQCLIKTFLRTGVRFIGVVREVRGFEVGDGTHISKQSCARDVGSGEELSPHLLAKLPGLPSVAVLPFRTVGPDRLSTYFGDGIVEDIVVSLASLKDLFVISRGSTLVFQRSSPNLNAVGRTLGVQYVVAGSVRRSGKRLRICVELCDAETEEVIWAERMDTALGDLFDIQDQIVQDIVATIAPNIRQEELRRALRKRPEDLSAYDCTLQALELLFRLEKESFEQASKLLLKAQTIDPDFALPYAWAAWTHMYRVALGWSQQETKDVAEATRLASVSLRRDPQNARALATYGHLHSLFHHDLDLGTKYVREAVSKSPNDPFCWALNSASACYFGQGEEAVSHAEKALRLSPLDKYRFYYLSVLGLAHYIAGRYGEAVKWGRAAMLENASFTPNARYLAASLAANGELSEAAEVANFLELRQPNFNLREYGQRHLPFRNTEKAQQLLDHLGQAGLPLN